MLLIIASYDCRSLTCSQALPIPLQRTVQLKRASISPPMRRIYVAQSCQPRHRYSHGTPYWPGAPGKAMRKSQGILPLTRERAERPVSHAVQQRQQQSQNHVQPYALASSIHSFRTTMPSPPGPSSPSTARNHTPKKLHPRVGL